MPPELHDPQPGSWPPGSSEMARLIREYDWSRTPLGPAETWPPHLRASIEIMLGCGFPATLQWSRDGILFYNDPYISLINGHHPRVFGTPILESFPEIATTYQPILDRVYRGETVTLRDQLYRYHRDGAPADSWFDLSHTPVFASGQSVAGVFVIGLETTARVLAEQDKSRTEQALHQSQERLRRVLETEAVGILFFNVEGTLIDANEVFLRMTGYTRQDIASGTMHWRTLTPPEHRAASEAELERYQRTGRIGPYEKEYLLKDGSRRWMLFAGRALGDGTVAEYCIDVTDRRRAEAALNKSERYFRALVNATSDVIFRMNADWTELSPLPSSGLLHDTGTPERDWLTKYIHPDDHSRVLEAIHLAIAAKSTFELEHRILQADGSIGWSFSRAIPLLDPDGNITEWFGAASNITARKRAETGLRENEKLAVVGRLASSIAHEINNPLEAVVNLIYLAQLEAAPGSRAYLDQAQLELARVSHIATETLRFNRRTTHASATDISELVDSVLALHQGRIRASQIEVERKYSGHEPVLLFANELRQVIANLIGNAIDALMDQQRRTLIIRVRQARHPQTSALGVRLTVADTGTGMSPATLRHLYEPFFTTKESTGTGLGLWVTQEIVRKHGGFMNVRSRTQRPSGTVFDIFIPAQPTPPALPLTSAAPYIAQR